MKILTSNYEPGDLSNPPSEEDFKIYSSIEGIVSASDKLITVISSLITIPVVVLNYVRSTHFRLLLTVVFALISSFALAFASNASRKYVISAVAAFVAVQVVFVGVTNEHQMVLYFL